MASITCPSCGAGNEPGTRFCGACGGPLRLICSACGETNAPGARFCSNCGTQLEDVRRAAEVAEERRLVSVLFADLVGFTSRAEQLDPEAVRGILDPYHTTLRSALERHGGTVEKFIGDAVMALFGAPVAHGDDPERAVRAALAIREAIADLNRQNPGFDLELRIGITTGEAVVLRGSRPSEEAGMAAGDVINTASRLQSAAPVDGILVDEETYRATRKVIDYEPAEPVVAKGKRKPVPVWRALGPAAETAERPLREVPLVGRRHELTVLGGIAERTLAGRQPHLVTVVGPPGIGKTRLSLEAAALVQEQAEWTVLRARSLPYGATPGLGPFAHQVKELAGIYETEAVAVAREKLERLLADRLGQQASEEIAGPLAVIVGLAPMEAVADRQASFYAARLLVESLAAERPVMLVYEDIHWTEDTDLDLVEHLASRLRDVPVLVLALARPELLTRRPGWGSAAPATTTLPLDPLSKAESRQLAQQLVSELAGRAGDDLAARLAETAEGNPLFIEELASSITERGEAIAEELPTSVRTIIAARLDALPEPERGVLLDASVIGKVFWRGALARLTTSAATLSDALDSLEARDFIRRQPTSHIRGDQEFVFKHMLIREVAHGMLPKATRRERHAAAARFIEHAMGERAPEWAAILTYHWREAGDPERELSYLLEAAERAWPGEAVSFFDRALELVPPTDAERRRTLRLRRAIALVRGGRYLPASEELGELYPELEGRERFDALFARADASFWLADAESSRAFGEQARALAVELGDEQLQAVVLSLLGSVAGMAGRVTEEIELLDRALTSWRPGSHRRELGVLYTQRSLGQYWIGAYEDARDSAAQGEEISLETLDAQGIVAAVSHKGMALAGLGRHEDALEVLAAGAARGRELELEPRWTSRLVNMWAGTLRELGAFEEARRLNEEAIEMGSRIKFPGSIVSGKIDTLFIDLALGDVGSAEAALPDLWEAAAATKGWHEWLWRIRLQYAESCVQLALQRSGDAAESAAKAVAAAEEYTRPKYAVAARLVLGPALMALKRHEDATGELRRALADAEKLGHPPSITAAAGKLREALYALGDDSGAAAVFEKARTTAEAFAAALSAERRESYLSSQHVNEALALDR